MKFGFYLHCGLQHTHECVYTNKIGRAPDDFTQNKRVLSEMALGRDDDGGADAILASAKSTSTVIVEA